MLVDWVRQKHQGQVIRRSGRPYFEHLAAVAAMAAPFTHFAYEIGLCHDLLEKTGTTSEELMQSLLHFGFHIDQAAYITDVVVELTDVFTKSAYPLESKEDRKQKEAERLINSSAGAQTVKYADLADNIQWMLKYDKQLNGYLLRKKTLMVKMSNGNEELRRQVLDTIDRLLA